MWSPETGPAELARVLALFDRRSAEELAHDFVSSLYARRSPCSHHEAWSVLTSLRRKRHFDLVLLVADGLIATDNATFEIRAEYAQALLDRGIVDAARAVLEGVVRDTGPGAGAAPSERGPEDHVAAHVKACGLLGRLHKQRYVNAAENGSADAAALRDAVSWYWRTYADGVSDPSRRWHAVNALALARRAEADGIPLNLEFDPRRLATDLRTAVQLLDAEGLATIWDRAGAIEASLALGDSQGAIGWARRYANDERVDAFEIASTLRQLVDVWCLSAESAPGSELLGLLEARLLSVEGGSVSIDGGGASAERRSLARLHRVFDGGFVHGRAYRLGLERAQSVARIGSNEYQGVGTGLLVRGGDLDPGLGDERLLLTCAHVVAGQPAAWPYALSFRDAVATFLFGRNAQDAPFTTRAVEVVWQSSAWELDACLLRLSEPPSHLEPCPIGALPQPAARPAERVFIAGYPRGESLQFSLYDNRVLGHDARLLHYRAAADRGSSGSPVFDTDWRVIALHHAGSLALPRLDRSGVHGANEGVLISAIAEALVRERRVAR